MVWWNWGIWADPIIDFGRELYVPWRLTEGEVLGRDIAWFNGPLSQYFNAAIFEVFGVSLRVLVLTNIVIACLVAFLLYGALREFASQFAATTGTAAFVLLCAFSHHDVIANFNWACPYSHEVTHGVLLALIAVRALSRWLISKSAIALIVAGFAAGLCFLTKPETFLAAGVASVAALFVAARNGTLDARQVAGFAAALAAPIAIAWIGIYAISDGQNATNLVVGAWKHVANPDLSGLLFYKSSLGLDFPAERLKLLGLATAVWLAVALSVWGAGRLARAVPSSTKALTIFGLALCALPLALPLELEDAMSLFGVAFTPLPICVALVLVVRLLDWRRSRANGRSLVFCVLALALLAKLGIFARLSHYGFALAAPALAVTAVLWIDLVPRWVERKGASKSVATAVGLGFLGALVALGLRIDGEYRSLKAVPVGYGADQLRARDNAVMLNMILDPLRTLDRDATFLVLPEGVMLNYLVRRRSPIRVINFMPPEIVMFGEDSILRELEATPPDLVLVHTRLTHEYGLPLFGRDYARGITDWLRRNYRVVASKSLGPDPLDPARVADRSLGWRVWKRIQR